MTQPSAYHQLGRFVVGFQHLENGVKELLVLLANTDSEAVLILVNELGFRQLLDTADVMFSRFVDVRRNTQPNLKSEFHRLMGDLGRLGTRRNELVHSLYSDWINIDGQPGLIRMKSRLVTKNGEREEKEEELQPQAFDDDLEALDSTGQELEHFRLLVIDWLYPDVES